MSRARSVLAVPLLLSLAACQVESPAEYTLRVAQSQSIDCSARLERDPRFNVLAWHMPLAGAPATPSQLSDRARPAKSERAALAAWKPEIARCRHPVMAAANDVARDAVRPLQRDFQLSDQVIDMLMRGDINWGEANRQRDAIALNAYQALWPGDAVHDTWYGHPGFGDMDTRGEDEARQARMSRKAAGWVPVPQAERL